MSVRRSLAQSGNTPMEVVTFVGVTVGKQRQTRLGSFSRVPQRTYVQGSEKMRSTRVRLSVSISALALSVSGLGGAAEAQTTPRQDVATEVEEIIVTARRRIETLDDIPASADVITGEQLDERGVDSGKDLTRQVAGLQVIDNGTGVSDEFVIRGEGNTRQNNAEAGSGLYRDGIFVPGGNIGGRNYVAADFFDIDRVEVLKGPQGSYFGRNALGGAVNILTARPRSTPSARIAAEMGVNAYRGLEGVANLPLDATSALRIGGYYNEQTEGFYTSSVDGRFLDARESWGLRGSISFQPTERFSGWLMIERGKEDAPRPEVFEEVLAVNDPPFNNPGPTGFSIPRFTKPIGSETRFTRDTTTTIADLSYAFDGVTFQSLTGYRSRENTSTQDLDFNAPQAVQRALTITGPAEEDFERLVQDVRLISDDARLNWLIGFEYTKVDSDFASNVLPDVPTVLPAGCAGNVCTLATAQTAARNAYRVVASTIDDTSYASYGAVSYDLTDRLEISADFRYTTDERNFLSLETRRLDNPATPANEQIQFLINRAIDYDVFTPGVSLRWEVTPTMNAYGRIATGYRAGGFNNDPGETNDGVSATALPPSYDPETIVSYEAGLKGRSGGFGRFELNVYYNVKQDTFINYAVVVGCGAVPPVGCPANTARNVGAIRNAGESWQAGAEVEWGGSWEGWDAFPGRIIYNFGLAWADGEYNEGIVFTNSATNPATTLAIRDLSGNRIARLRDLTSTSEIGWRGPLFATGLDFFFSLIHRGELGGFEDPANTFKYDDVQLVDAVAGVRGEDWSLVFNGKNIFDHSYFNISPINQTFGTQQNEPFSWRVRLSKSF